MKFENEKAMYDAIQNGLDLYNINTGDYVFSYSDRGAIAVYNLVLEYAKDLSSHSAGEYWGALLGAGGYIYENGGELEWCEEHYNDDGWEFTKDLDKNGGNRMTTGKQYVKISVNELANLLEAKETLSALKCGGVDNWEWYGGCFSDYIEDNNFNSWDEYIETVTSNITKDYEVVE